MQRILVFGASGFLGSNLDFYLKNDFEVIGTRYRAKIGSSKYFACDATNSGEIDSLIETINPDIIINCSGLANVDDCEKRPEAAILLNSILASDLAKITNKQNIKFVHISTDHFESLESSPRNELESMWPINQYGYSKLLAENFIREFNPGAIIIRTNFFGWGDPSKSLIAWLAESFATNSDVNGFTDVTFNPVSTEFLSQAIIALCSVDFSGLVNISATESVTKYDFAKRVDHALGNTNSLIKMGRITDSNLPTKRPGFLALDNSKLRNLDAIPIPPIDQMLDNICGDSQAQKRLQGHEKGI